MRFPSLRQLVLRTGAWFRQGERRPVALALGSYLFLIVLYAWPAVLKFQTRVWGEAGDVWIALWDAWWFERVAHDGVGPLHTRMLFYPYGTNLAYHSISWLSAVIAFPLRAVFGPFGGYNLMSWFEAWLCAASMYALGRKLMPGQLGPWLAGVVFAFEPYRMSRALQHPNLAGTGFVPLVILYLLSALRGEGRRYGWFAALALAAVLLTGAHLFIMTTAAILLVAIGQGLANRRFATRAFWVGALHFALASALLLVPLMLPYVRSARALRAAIHAVAGGESLDAWSLVLPGPGHWLFAGPSQGRYRFYGEAASVGYLGFSVLAVATFAFFRRETRRSALPWLLLFAAFLVLSLGPVLIVNHHVVFRSMPYRWVSRLTAVQAIRDPERFNLIARPFLALCAGFGLVALQALTKRRRLVTLGAAGLVVLDLSALPAPARAWREPKFFADLGRQGGKGAILDLPLTRGIGKRAMLSQTVHGRPLVGGMIARPAPGAFRYMREVPLLRALKGEAPTPYRCGALDLRKEFARLRKDGVEYVVVWHKFATARQRAAYATYFPGKPQYADAQVEVFAISDLLERAPRC